MDTGAHSMHGVQRQEKPRIVFFHSDVRSYRIPIFSMLHERFDIHFYFLSKAKLAKNFPETASWTYEYLAPVRIPGYGADACPAVFSTLWKERKNYDVIITSGLASFATHAAFLMAKVLKKRFIVWGEDWMWSDHVVYRLARPYARFIVLHADACIAAGTKSREFFLSFGASADHVFVAPNAAEDLGKLPVDTAAIEALRKKVNPSGKKIIAYLGRFSPWKNPDALFRAFARLEKERDDVLLLAIGNGPLAPVCRDIVRELNIQNIYWPLEKHGAIPDSVEPVARETLINYLRLADIFVLPGRFQMNDVVPSESWGLILNEAMSLGKPIISTTSVAAAYDLIENGVNGFQVEENDSNALVHALQQVLTHDLAAMGKESRSIITEKGSYVKMFSGFTKAIRSVENN